jgi:hypothetical protein
MRGFMIVPRISLTLNPGYGLQPFAKLGRVRVARTRSFSPLPAAQSERVLNHLPRCGDTGKQAQTCAQRGRVP